MSPASVLLSRPELMKLLSEAGWSPDRRIAIEHWIEPLEKEGYQSFPSAREFLEKFGGLNLNAYPAEPRAFNPGRSRLDPVLAASGEADRIKSWATEFNLTLFPVGNVFDDYFILLITPESKFYVGSYDDEFAFLAPNLGDGLEQLLFAPNALEFLSDQ